MSQPPRYFAVVILAILAFCTFLIPVILVVYVGHAFFYGPAWLSSQSGTIQVLVECFMVLLGGLGLLVQWLGFWLLSLVVGLKARYEYRYTRYLRAGHDPSEWAHQALL